MSKTEKPAIFRGQVYLYDFGKNTGSVQSGVRPVLVIQCNDLNRGSSTVIVAAITTVDKRANLKTHVVLPPIQRLVKKSIVMLEQIRTVSVDDLGVYCGYMRDPSTWGQIEKALRKVLAMSKKEKYDPMDVHCLCSKCVSYYSYSPEYSVRRLSPPDGTAEECEKCGFHRGFDYLITVRKPFRTNSRVGGPHL